MQSRLPIMFLCILLLGCTQIEEKKGISSEEPRKTVNEIVVRVEGIRSVVKSNPINEYMQNSTVSIGGLSVKATVYTYEFNYIGNNEVEEMLKEKYKVIKNEVLENKANPLFLPLSLIMESIANENITVIKAIPKDCPKTCIDTGTESICSYIEECPKLEVVLSSSKTFYSLNCVYYTKEKLEELYLLRNEEEKLGYAGKIADVIKNYC